jgi:iron complex outermembrane receptor protein
MRLLLRSPIALAVLACLASNQAAQAQTTTATSAQLPPVTVTATKVDTPAFDVPASIDRVDGDSMRDGHLGVNISDGLAGVPGLLARDRQNYAQDVQISVRGFGARSTFGIRGVRLYVDGIPATLPDGQGQITNVDIGSLGRLEVLRGPFSALYGNSSGGVIQAFTEDPADKPTLGFSVAGGSDGELRYGTKLSGNTGAFGYVASASQFSTDGYRDHSSATRRIGNLKLTFTPDADDKFTLIANSVDLPRANDPLGLTRAQFQADPRSVDPSANAFNTRKTVEQNQAGLIYERRVDGQNSLRAMVYGGERRTQQFQSIPVATQVNPLNPGGVISLEREYSGADFRWTLATPLAGRPFTLVGGLTYDTLREHREGYQSFTGPSTAPTAIGVIGALRRDEINDVSNLDPYAQASWQFAPQWTLDAGVRRSQVRFTSTDRYVVGTNPNDSGGADYSATLPVVGLMFAMNESVHFYVTAGRGFETPTLNELAYQPNGATGLNFGLQPATSDSVEFGVKTRLSGFGDFRAAVFQTSTNDEIVTLSNLGGRTTYENAGSTRRRGLELAWSQTIVENVEAQAVYTLLDAVYRDGFSTCTVTPCATPNQVIPGGSKMPGIAKSSLFASIGWAPPQGFRTSIDARAISKVYVNDANSDAAPGNALVGANVGYRMHIGHWQLGTFVRVDNIFDRQVIGSVIVNEGNSRFFEPAPGRTWLAGVNASVTFE